MANVLPQNSQRKDWPVQKGTLRELEADDIDLSDTTTVEQRFDLMWQLSQQVWSFRGVTSGEPGLSRSAGQLIRRAG